MRTEGLVDPVGVDEQHPVLSWTDLSPEPSTVVLSDDSGELWRATVPPFANQVTVSAPLSPLVRYRWQRGDRQAAFVTGLRGPWPAQWLAGGPGAVALTAAFDWDGGPEPVWLAATALGVYRAHVNGSRVSDEEFAPGWTDYTRRVRYRLHDVTPLLRSGSNEVELWLAPGWYSGHVAQFGAHRYGEVPAASCAVRRDDATLLVTGPQWTIRDLGRPRADLIMGETAGPPRPGTAPATVVDPPGITVEADPSPPVRPIAELAPVAVTQPAEGVQILDFGRNIVGRLRLRIPDGSTVTVRHGEELSPSGDLYTENLRTADQRDVFSGPGDVEPAFALHGFRYAEVTGWPGELTADSVTAVVLSTALPVTGSVTASDPVVNQLVANIGAGIDGNVVSVPTDCPQRDERVGWTADISVFASTLAFLRDSQAFLSGWLTTLIDGQRADGSVPHVAPVMPEYGFGAPVWSDTIVELPWLLWRRYGDRRTLERAYDPMRRWVDFCLSETDDGIRPAQAFGDWLAPGFVETPRSLIGTAALSRSLRLVAQIGDLLGRESTVDYRDAADKVTAAFRREWLDGARLRTPTQTGYAIALAWDLVEPAHRPALAEALAALVAADGFRLTTGFVGTPLLLPTLSEAGFHDTAAKVFNQEGYPSWRYQIRAGATTMWERWNSWHHRTGYPTPTMNSFNHYAYGCVGDWLIRYVAGISDDPGGTGGGFRDLVLRPGPIPLLRHVQATYRGPSGTVVSGWRADPGGLTFHLRVPPGVTARAVLPVGGGWDGMTVNGNFLMGLDHTLRVARHQDGSASLSLPAGRWTFAAPAPFDLFDEWDRL